MQTLYAVGTKGQAEMFLLSVDVIQAAGTLSMCPSNKICVSGSKGNSKENSNLIQMDCCFHCGMFTVRVCAGNITDSCNEV